ncbi:hypothetical protein TRFO_33724 [Tritrichomonas foetus]|uniref:Protein kinase domain-containing protein n=1 Tax=Tritrichomonas foetus TaxID=1144522 RepID=A0A1J4JQG9_9EUKA|nr:hypothetical protein TRFO_33724 [Tritrichomonas foetus]|eukprot:OHS99763.1 hypothetical protein TRFO_33724 [Tritrichomonas foetus]
MNHHFSDLCSIRKEIGRGAYGTVYSAILLKPFPPLEKGAKVAIKSIPTSRITTPHEKEKLEMEINLMATLDHPNIVKLYGVEKTTSHYYLILECCDGGDLYNYIHMHEGGFPENIVRDFASQIASGLFYLHAHQIVHRDLKPHNILISRNSFNSPTKNVNLNENRINFQNSNKITLKIADFGFARFLRPCDLATTVCGSPVYMAPEIQFGSQYSSNVDMWSLGIILFELITKKTPFPHVKTQYELAMELRARGSKPYCLPISAQASSELRNLIQRLLTINPCKRMSFDEFINDPFINVIDCNDKTSNQKKSPAEEYDLIDLNNFTNNFASSSHAINNNNNNHTTTNYNNININSTNNNTTNHFINNADKEMNKNLNDVHRIKIIHNIQTNNNINNNQNNKNEINHLQKRNKWNKSRLIKPKFSFLAASPDADDVVAENYLIDALNCSETIASHFTECQLISNSLLISLEILVIHFLFDFFYEEKQIRKNHSTNSKKYSKNGKKIQKDVLELAKCYIDEVEAIIDIKLETPPIGPMQFLFDRAIELAKAAANFEIDKNFSFAKLKYQKALHMLSPIVFSLKTNDQIRTARCLYKRIDLRLFKISNMMKENPKNCL